LIILLSLFVCFASFIPHLNEYSAITTLKKIFSLNKNSSTYSFLNGIRAISLFWIILGHSFVFQLTIADNIVHILDNLHNSYAIQLMLGAIFGVDTFFFISGFLAVFVFINTFKNQGILFEEIKNKMGIIFFYFRCFSFSTFICLLFSSLLSFNSNISICITY
jgi:peptidoglycan/LPS O-acetylase OafA/YrhL